MAYGADIKAEARAYIVEDGLTPEEASIRFGGNPAAATIRNWASRPDKGGLTWWDHKHELEDALYNATTPRALASRLMEEIERVIMRKELDEKKADALAKYVRVLKEVADPKHQVSAMYQVLGDLMAFLHENYPASLTPTLAEAIREFKNQLRKRLI